jgi:hypothetical protein
VEEMFSVVVPDHFQGNSFLALEAKRRDLMTQESVFPLLSKLVVGLGRFCRIGYRRSLGLVVSACLQETRWRSLNELDSVV